MTSTRIAIPSLGPPAVLARNPLLHLSTVALHRREQAAYQAAFDARGVQPAAIIWHEVVGLSETRNLFLDQSEPGQWWFFVDDELEHVRYQFTRHTRRTDDPETMLAIIDSVRQTAEDIGTPAFGFAVTGRVHERRSTEPFVLRRWVNGGAMGIKNMDRLRFDVRTIHDDIDMSLQVLAGWDVLPADQRYYWHSPRWTDGGMTYTRNSVALENSAKYLQRKWGGDVVQVWPSRRKSGQGFYINVNVVRTNSKRVNR